MILLVPVRQCCCTVVDGTRSMELRYHLLTVSMSDGMSRSVVAFCRSSQYCSVRPVVTIVLRDMCTVVVRLSSAKRKLTLRMSPRVPLQVFHLTALQKIQKKRECRRQFPFTHSAYTHTTARGSRYPPTDEIRWVTCAVSFHRSRLRRRPQRRRSCSATRMME